MQVKVEEVEMETPIDPPNNAQQVSLSIVKQEEGGEQSKLGLHQAPKQSSLENTAQEKRKPSEAAAERSEELGSLDESFTGESIMQQSENEKRSGVETSQKLNRQEESHADDSTMEENSESNTEQDTAGEAAGMVGLDEEVWE